MKQVIYAGDWHGNFSYIKEEIIRRKIGNNDEVSYIIQVGDFGIGFYPKKDIKELVELNKFFQKNNIICIVFRGNHDDPKYFNGDYIYSNLLLVPDYTVMDIYDKKHLFIGGAISIDRSARINEMSISNSYGINDISYWVDEPFVLDIEKLKDIKNIDVLVTHTAPHYCAPSALTKMVLDWIKRDNSLYYELQKERDDMSMLIEILKNNSPNIESHFYGHFHFSATETIKGITHHLLNINEFKCI